MNRIQALALTILAALLLGCASPYEDNVTKIPVDITTSSSDTLFILVKLPVENMDDDYDPELSFYMPIGKYLLEGEDANYWYFHATKPISVNRYEFGKKLGGTRIPGGIALSKTGDNVNFPPYFYGDDKDLNHKVLVWKTSPTFLKERGTRWFLSTDAEMQ